MDIPTVQNHIEKMKLIGNWQHIYGLIAFRNWTVGPE